MHQALLQAGLPSKGVKHRLPVRGGTKQRRVYSGNQCGMLGTPAIAFFVPFKSQEFGFLYIASPQQDDLRLLGPPLDQGTGGGARTRDRRVVADLRMDSLTTVPLTPQTQSELELLLPCGGDGGTVVNESALRSAGTLLSRVRAPIPAPYLTGGDIQRYPVAITALNKRRELAGAP
ncbi:hypothetical protein PoB_000007000 [Plakobranchus ocellatus]|uniref:Ribosomal protein S2 n=1 Tax=Plakobranchus ocellatus TaxID=259542 RepID=A0AAV3XQ07_9GAST|nr:hypothetical protein PoB_000007000 [Plakobranchus ocellatus]